MKNYNSLIPSLIYNTKKAIFFYLPFLIFLSLIFSINHILYWSIFFIFVLFLEVFDYFPNQNNSIVSKIISRVELIIKSILSFVLYFFLSTKSWAIIGLICFIIYFYIYYYFGFGILDLTRNTKEFVIDFLSIYIGVFGVLLGLGFTNQQRILDKYNDLTSERVLKYIGIYYIYFYVLFFILTSFCLILFSTEIDSYKHDIFNYNLYFISNFFILTVVFALLSKDYFYAGTSQGVLNIFSDFLVKLLKKNSTFNFFGLDNKRENFKRSEFNLKIKLFIQKVAFKLGNFIFGKPIILTLGYYKGNTIDLLKEDIQVLYRIGLTSIENKNTITFKFCLESIEKVFGAYLKYGDEYSGSDDFTLFIQQETKTLFENALKKDYQPEFIDLVTKFTYNLTLKASRQPLKNGFGSSETYLFEKILTEFCIKAWTKVNAHTTSISITYLREIGYSYIDQNKYISAMGTIERLFDISEAISVLENDDWQIRKTFQIINSVIKIYYHMLIVIIYDSNKYTSFRDYEVEGFYKKLEKNLLRYGKQDNPNSYSFRETQFFYDELYSGNIIDRSNDEKIRPIYDYILQAIFEIGLPISENKKKFLYDELSRLSILSYKIFQQGNKYHSEYEDLAMFIYNMIDTIYNLYTAEKNEEKKDLLFEILNKNFSVFYGINIGDMEEIGEKSGSFFYSCIIIFVIIARREEKFLIILKSSISKIINLFNQYNDENDIYKRKRKFLYKYILFIASWIYNYHFNIELYSKLEKIISSNYEFRTINIRSGWGSYDNGKYSLDNMPNDGNMLGYNGKIWNINLSCYRDNNVNMKESDYKGYCDYLNNKYIIKYDILE